MCIIKHCLTRISILIAKKFKLHKSFRNTSVQAILFSECLRVTGTFSFATSAELLPRAKFSQNSQESILQRSLTSWIILFCIESWSQFFSTFLSIEIYLFFTLHLTRKCWSFLTILTTPDSLNWILYWKNQFDWFKRFLHQKYCT